AVRRRSGRGARGRLATARSRGPGAAAGRAAAADAPRARPRPAASPARPPRRRSRARGRPRDRALAGGEPARARRDRGEGVDGPVRLRRRGRARRRLARGSRERPRPGVRGAPGVRARLQRAGGEAAHARGVRRVSAHPGPLAGIQVLDLSIALTGPYAAALLADQGAEVVKVERPGIGDIARWIGVAVNGMSALYLSCNRGKRSIAVDMATRDGAEVVRRLAATADVVLQNFRPGVMERLGLGYEEVRALNPDVVYCSLSGFGAEGPYRDRSAYDTVMQAYGGFAASQADPADGVPVFLRQTAADKVTALFASQAITAALFARE